MIKLRCIGQIHSVAAKQLLNQSPGVGHSRGDESRAAKKLFVTNMLLSTPLSVTRVLLALR